MKRTPLKIFLLFAVNFFFSCTPYKLVPYFQDLKKEGMSNENITNYTPLIIQAGDLLGINVTSLNHEADMIYNLSQQVTPDINGTDRSNVVGYLVDREGNIKLPNIGIVKVSGYTTKEIATELESKLRVYLSQPTVNVRMLNFRISVLGDVKSPGNFTVSNEFITLPQALSLAGDLNSTGIRNILLIREKAGSRQYINIDLTSSAIFNSPYYYLQNNDIIYVQPGRAKVVVDRGSYQKIGVVLTALSIIVFLIRRY